MTTKEERVNRARRHIVDCSLRSKRFREAKSEERGFLRFTSAKTVARASYFCSRPIFQAEKIAENPVLRSLLHGNACYAGY